VFQNNYFNIKNWTVHNEILPFPKYKLRNMTPREDDERKTFLGAGEGRGGEGNPFFLGINRRWFKHTAKRLRTRKYPFKPARQVNIPNPGKPKETRLLAMIGLKDHQVI